MHHYLADTASQNPLLPSWPEFIIGTICFVLVFGVLGKMLLPRIQQTLAERTEQIEGGLARAEKEQEEAQRVLEEYKQQLADARHEAARLREQGAQIIAEMRQQAEAEARRITEAAQTQIESERQQALASLRTEVGALATDLASRIVGESLTDEVRQTRMVDRFLEEIEQSAGRAAAGGRSSTAGRR